MRDHPPETNSAQTLREQDHPSREPDHKAIAIIGIGCRFPGADGPEAFWRLLASGEEAITAFPNDRFDLDKFFDSRPGVAGKLYTRYGGFLDRIEEFDASFFGIPPRELISMDPQHRILLELAWESLEDAGQLRARLEGSRTGVFLGIWINDFDDLLARRAKRLGIYSVTGGGRFSASGRISHFFGFEGPSLVVDTACSSGLTAVHLACQSLRGGESELALAGGVNLILHPQVSIGFCGARMLSPDGRCKFADATADGFGRSDGAGIVVLKELSRALADGDPIYAVIPGSAANNNGRTSGQMVVPGSDGQAEAIRRACHEAGIAPAEIDYVEAHGTGTPVGDPVELAGLAEVLVEGGRGAERPCLVGSVKTNIGHTEAAAGVAGLIKLALSLDRREIPPSLLATEVNPKISWDELPLELVRERRPWPEAGRPLRAGVTSTGLSGSNVHVIVEQAPPEAPRTGRGDSDRCRVLTLSAHTPEALAETSRRYSEVLSQPRDDLADICWTARARRTHHEHRLAVTGRSADEMRGELEAFLAGESSPGLFRGSAAADDPGKLVFVFPGQGSQWLGMGRELLEHEDVFRAEIERCGEAVRRHVEWSLIDELQAPEDVSRLGEMDVVQPVLFAMEMALAALWRSWGVEPAAVVGHSMGEVAAVCFAGGLELDDAARIITRRSRLLRRISGMGAMALVELPMEEAKEALAGYEDRLSIAVNNSPSSTVLAGDPAALEEIVQGLVERDVFCRPVKVTVAAHSPQIDPLRKDLREILRGIRPRRTELAVYSTVATRFGEGQRFDAEYWVENLRQPVLFGPALESLIGSGHHHFIEMSPHPILVGAVQEALDRAGLEREALASLRRGEKERATLLASYGKHFVAGGPLEPGRLDSGRCVRLPPLAWQRERFPLGELRATAPGNETIYGVSAGGHAVLGRPWRSALTPEERFWSFRLETEELPYLEDHRVGDSILVPAAAFLDLTAAAAAHERSRAVRLEDVRFEHALALAGEGAAEAQLVLSEEPDRGRTFRFFRNDGDEWTLCAHGTIHEVDEPDEAPPPRFGELEELRQRCGEPRRGAEIYRSLAARGHRYGPAFQGLEEVWARPGEAIGRIRSAQGLELDVSGYEVHPALLDSALQLLLIAGGGDTCQVPVALDAFRLYGRPEPDADHWGYALARRGSGAFEGDVFLIDESGRVVAEAQGIRFQAYEVGAGSASSEVWLHEIEWLRSDRPADVTPEATGNWLVFADSRGFAEALGKELEERGGHCTLVQPGSGCAKLSPGLWSVDPECPEDFRRLLGALGGKELENLRGIAYLWAVQRDVCDETSAESLAAIQGLALTSVLHLVQALVAEEVEVASLCLITRGAQPIDGMPVAAEQAPIWGLGRVIANEHPELRARCVDLGWGTEVEEARSLAATLLDGDAENELALRDGERLRPSLRPFDPAEAPAVMEPGTKTSARVPAFGARIRSVGLLDGLELNAVGRRAPGPGEVEIDVAFTGLNFKDVLYALGQIPAAGGRPELGFECTGTVVRVGESVGDIAVGDEVVAVAANAFASHVTTDARLVQPRPAGLSAEQAATVSIAYTTAYYGLVELGRLRPGERVLIHAAAGGVGLAAIEIARHVGAEVYATAGREHKRQHLREMGLKHVFDSRRLDFADEIRAATGGEGVDVVLNSLAGASIERSFACLRSHGRFVELGKVEGRGGLALDPFRRNLAFFVVDLERMYREERDRFQEHFAAALELFAAAKSPPLPLSTFGIGDIKDAFRLMSGARHIGKIVVRIAGEDVALSPPPPGHLRADASYLITGGLGGIGLTLAEWMIERGAEHLVLVGRSGASSEARRVLDRLRRQGAEIVVARADVSDAAELGKVLARIEATLPPLAGIFHGAMVLDDGVLGELDGERLARVLAPKVLGAWNLHRASLVRPLDHFVLFSSATTLIGSPGQGNYVAANAYLDALAHARRARGLPATAIDWGPWAEVGMAAREGGAERLVRRGLKSFTPDQGLEILGRLMALESPQVAVMPTDGRRLAQHFNDEPPVLFAELLARQEAPATIARDVTVAEAVRAAAPEEQRELLEDHLRQAAGKVMGLAASKVAPTRALDKMGLDSLMALELRNRIGRELGFSVSIPRLLQGLSVRKLVGELCESLAADQLLHNLDDLSESDVDALLEDMLVPGSGAGVILDSHNSRVTDHGELQ